MLKNQATFNGYIGFFIYHSSLFAVIYLLLVYLTVETTILILKVKIYKKTKYVHQMS